MALLSKKKRKVWCWFAICRASKGILAYEIGRRGVKTARKLWDKIKNSSCQYYCTDAWKPYQQILPPEKHIISKAETYTIEGYNALFRHYLARFHRKTKCYSKKMEMIENTIILFISYLNNRNKNNYI